MSGGTTKHIVLSLLGGVAFAAIMCGLSVLGTYAPRWVGPLVFVMGLVGIGAMVTSTIMERD
jgi:hypothetical protein